MLEIRDLGVHFGERTLFENVSLLMHPGHRYGLIGANGAGKSTFLSVLTGEMSGYVGTLSWPSDVKVGILKQDHFRYEEQSLLDTVMQGRPALWQAMQEQQKLRAKGEFSEADTAAYARAEAVIEKENGYAAASEAARLLNGLGLEASRHELPLKTLSGGYKLRVLMAQLLFSSPDILLLDEPTNHLDLYAIQWLAGYLSRFAGLLIVVSHDRAFLDEVSTDIIDIDYGTLKVYSGNYESFLSAKLQAREQKEKELGRQDKLREETQKFIDRFRAKATKASAVQSRVKMLEKLDDIDLQPSSRRYPSFDFEAKERSGNITLKVKHISKTFAERKVLDNVTFEVERGDKIALIGPNGIGKSTLLKIMMQEIKADEGKITWGHETHPGYFPQDYRQVLPPDKSLYDWLSGFAGDQPETRVRGLLGRMLFEGNVVRHKISTLSGGEATRLVFSRLMLEGGNVLVLDEPTNHLDMEAIDTLAEALQAYPGTLIFVSHNRYFVSEIATRILEITPEGLQDFKGTYAEYLEKQNVDHLSRSQLPRQSQTVSNEKQQQQVDYEARKTQQRRLRNLEKKIPELETRCQQLEDSIASNDIALAEAYANADANQQEKLLTRQKQLQQELEQRFEEWESTESEYQQLLANDEV